MRPLTDAMRSELSDLCGAGELLKPCDVITFARNKRTALHSRFTWDDTEAAHQYRLEEARRVIRVSVVVLKSGSAPVRAYVSLKADRSYDTDNEGGYRAIVDVLDDDTLRETMLEEAKDDMALFRRKYNRLKELEPVFVAMDKVTKKKSRRKTA